MTNIKHLNTIDLTGKRFGKLLVKKQISERGNRGQIRWECLCDCGNKHITSGESIRSGKSKSCGCLRKNAPNKLKDRKLAIWKQLYNSTVIKRNRKWGINGDLSLDDFIFFSNDKNIDAVKDNYKPPRNTEIRGDAVEDLLNRLGFSFEDFMKFIYHREYYTDNGYKIFTTKDVADFLKPNEPTQ